MSTTRAARVAARDAPERQQVARLGLHLRVALGDARPSRARRRGRVRADEVDRDGATSRPSAASTPAAAGQTTWPTPSRRATPSAWTGPAPPKATSAYIGAGRAPRSATWIAAAPATMFSLTTCVDAVRRRRPTSGRAGSAELALDRLARGLDVERHPPAEEVAGVEVAEHEVGVGDRRLACRRARSRPGPGSAPALRGPTFSRPSSSTRAIEPPPAPISISSIDRHLRPAGRCRA